MSNISLLAFGTFGSPNGFTQTFFSGKKIENVKTFDIRASILVYPQSTLYSIRKQSVGGIKTIAYSIYTYAKEPTSAREGSLIGSALLFSGGKIGEENITIKIIDEFHNNLVKKNVQNERILVGHSDQFKVVKPTDLDKIEFNLKDMDSDFNFLESNKSLFVYCKTSPENLQNYFKKSLDLLSIYDNIFFTENFEIVDYIKRKGSFKIVQQDIQINDFDQEIINLENERKSKIESKITELEKEKNSSEEKRKTDFLNFDNILKRDEAIQIENKKKLDATRSNKNSVDNLYRNYTSKIDELKKSLLAGKNLNEIANLQRDLKNKFEKELRNFESNATVQSISNVGSRKVPSNPNGNETHRRRHYNDDLKENDKNSNLPTYLSLLLNAVLIILILLIIYFPFWKDETSVLDNQISQVGDVAVYEQPQNVEKMKLNPIPNDSVGAENLKKVIAEIINDQKIEKITKKIFEQNPKSIGNIYKYQKHDFSLMLFQKNPAAFEIKGSDTIMVHKDSLKSIPSLKIN